MGAGGQLTASRVEYISVCIDPAPGDLDPCPWCGGSMDKVFLKFVVESASLRIKNKRPVPGYRCRGCGAEWYEGSTTLHLFTEMLLKLDLSGDPELLEALRQRVASLTEALARMVQSRGGPAQLPLERRSSSDGRE